jgi:hypothetical protein
MVELMSMVESKKIQSFVKEYPKNKACGVDSIHTNLLVPLLQTSFFSRLSELYRLCIRTGATPSQWNRSIMYLLPKKNEPPITCESVRPLSILPMFRRVFESLLIPAFVDSSKAYTRLHYTQAGFRKGYSTMTHAAICHHVLATEKIEYAVFLDFKAAYDMTPADRVLRNLQQKGLPVRLQHLIQSLMFTNGSFQLVVNGQLSSTISRNRGLPQGSPLSPIIFNLFIDSLNYELNDGLSEDVPQSLFFADDGLLLCRSHFHAVRLLEIASQWANDNGMVFNVSKCGILSPTVGKKPLYLNGEEIQQVSEYKYLGFLVKCDGIDFNKHVEVKVESCRSFLKFLQIQCSEWSPYTRFIIYNTFLRPKLEYGAPLVSSFASTNLDEIQKLQNDAVAWIFNSNTRRLNVLNGILGVLNVENRFAHLRCSFQLHLDYMADSNPLRRLITSSIELSPLRRNNLYEHFTKIPELPIDYKALQYRMSEFLLSQRMKIIIGSSSILVGYIALSARTNGLVDKVLMAPLQYQRVFLLWRRGGLFLSNICTCGERWHRGHIPCLPSIELSEKQEEDFLNHKEKHGKNFCKLDYLLNEGDWKMAFEIITKWKEVFERK